MLTAAHLRGQMIGAAILSGFGCAWVLLALANWPRHPGWSLPAACIVTLLLLVLCVLRYASASNLPNSDDPMAAARGKRMGIVFGIVFGLEGGFIALSSVLLVHFNLAPWIPVATAVIVGIHFLPLASVFGVPLYYWTGGLCMLGVLACLFIHDVPSRVLSVCLVMAAVLWGAVTALLLQGKNGQPLSPES